VPPGWTCAVPRASIEGPLAVLTLQSQQNETISWRIAFKRQEAVESPARVTGATEWHVNADEPALLDYVGVSRLPGPHAATPWRASDHDPSLIGLRWDR